MRNFKMPEQSFDDVDEAVAALRAIRDLANSSSKPNDSVIEVSPSDFYFLLETVTDKISAAMSKRESA